MKRHVLSVLCFGLCLGALTAGCRENRAAPAAADVDAAAVSAAPLAVGSAVAIRTITIRGKAKRAISCSWMPGAKDPSGKDNGGCEVYVEGATVEPAVALASVAIDDEAPSLVEPNLGKCKASLSKRDLGAVTEFSVSFRAPGCDTFALFQQKLPRGIQGSVNGKIEEGSRLVPVVLKLVIEPAP